MIRGKSPNTTKEIWLKDNLVHRKKGIAVHYKNGKKEWKLNGKRHRDNGLPASVDGEKLEWWVKGRRHRDNGLPAVEDIVKKEWWEFGKRNRKGDLPAIEYFNGDKEWYKKDKRHRDNRLPAVKYSTGIKEYWFDGRHLFYNQEEDAFYLDFKKEILHSYGDYATKIQKNGTKEYYCDNFLHRENFPAVIYPNGDFEY
jgi:hypothetical protein